MRSRLQVERTLSLLGIGLGLALGACSGGTVGDSGDASGGSASGGSATGGSATGGAHASGGSDAAGGSATGGTHQTGSGGRGDLQANECTVDHACGEGATCYLPGSPPPAICGAPDWCGQCNCPPMPFVPEGSGQACTAEAPCPAANGNARSATSCDEASSKCGECLTSDDCPEALPFCGTEGLTGSKMCFECEADADCPEDRPACDVPSSTFGSFSGGMCVQCTASHHCTAGICSAQRSCTPECTTDAQCGPDRECSDEQRCSIVICSTGAECAPTSRCDEEGIAPICVPKDCSTDADCGEGNHCVSGGCYETPGTCVFDLVP